MIASGIGSMPGATQGDFTEALRLVLDELPDLPFLPEVPGRGVIAGMAGRTLGAVTDLGIDLQPAGWRLTDAAGVDHRRARSLLAQDLDGLEELAEGVVGAFKIQVAGPWTLAATVEKPRGDKVLSDHGARRELAQALSAAVVEHVHDVRRRLPGVDRLIVQVDEPALAAVVAGTVPTASGLGRHRVVHPPEISEHLTWVLGAIARADAEPWVHACAPGTPLHLLRGAGARGVAVDLAQVDDAGHDVLAETLDGGDAVALGAIPTSVEDTPSEGVLIDRLRRWFERVGLDPATEGARTVLTPGCGLAGATHSTARLLLQRCRSVAAELG